MSDVNFPEDWELSPVSNAIAIDGIISDGDWVESKDQDPNGAVRLIQLADIGDGSFKNKSERFMSHERAEALNCTFIKSGDILIARMPDPLGRACLFPGVGQDAVTVVDICLIRTGERTAISNRLLTYWINSPSIRSLISANASGTTRKRITRKKLELFEFPIPPLAEQKIIADKLDTILAQVETTKAHLERIPEILKTFRQSVLAAAVSGKLTEEWRAEGFTLANIADFQNGFAFKSGWFEANGEYQVVKLGNIRDGNLALENSPAYLKKAIAEEYLRFVPQTGDTLLSMTGTRFKKDYGFGCIIKGESNLLVNQRVGRLIPNRELVLPEYLNIFVRSELFRVQFFKGETGGVNQGNVGSKHIMGIKITLPNIDQQTKIVSRVEDLFSFADNIEQKASAALKRVNNLTQSILAKAFRGELTADWRAENPDFITGENSAESLLKKITAEQQKLRANKTRKR